MGLSGGALPSAASQHPLVYHMLNSGLPPSYLQTPPGLLQGMGQVSAGVVQSMLLCTCYACQPEVAQPSCTCTTVPQPMALSRDAGRVQSMHVVPSRRENEGEPRKGMVPSPDVSCRMYQNLSGIICTELEQHALSQLLHPLARQSHIWLFQQHHPKLRKGPHLPLHRWAWGSTWQTWSP